MKPWFWIGVLLVLGACTQKSKNPVSTEFETLKGEKYTLPYDKNSKGTVYIFLLPDCPFSQFYTMAINQVYSNFESKGYKFYGIIPGNLYSTKEIDSFQKNFDFIPLILIDKNYELTKKLSVKVVPQVVFTDKIGNIIYSGKIDDQAIQPGQKKYQPTQFYLLDALKSHSKGELVKVKETKPVGCFIEM